MLCRNMKIINSLAAFAVFPATIFAIAISLSASVAMAQSDLESLLSPDMGGMGGISSSEDDAIPEGPLSLGSSIVSGLGLAEPTEDKGFDEDTLQAREDEIRKSSFDAALQGIFPMRPKEIRQLLEYYDNVQESVQVPVYPYPRPEVAVINLSLDPGVTPPIISLSAGHVTTINLLDVTGAPWPIQDISFAGKFSIVEPEEGGHVLRITPLEEYSYGNISIRMLTLKTPITFTLRTQRDIVHYRVDARVPEYGPFANAPLIDGGMTLVAGDPDVTSVLDGVPPQTAEKLTVSGVDGRTTAYLYNDKAYVRTPLTLLSPGWEKSVSSADGMNVYALAFAPVLLLSDEGKMVRAYITRKEESYE